MDPKDEVSRLRTQRQIIEDYIDSLKRTYRANLYLGSSYLEGSLGETYADEEAFLDALKFQPIILDNLHDIILEVSDLSKQANTEKLRRLLRNVDHESREIHSSSNYGLSRDPLIKRPTN